MYHQSVRLALDERRAGERNDQRHEDADPDPSRDQVGGSIDARLQAMSGLLDEQQGPVTALLGPRTGVPLNQEDLLGMLLTFGITVFEVLERYGVNWTADEQDAYLHAWDVIGAVPRHRHPRRRQPAGAAICGTARDRGWAASAAGPDRRQPVAGAAAANSRSRRRLSCSRQIRARASGWTPTPRNLLRFRAGRAFVPVAS